MYKRAADSIYSGQSTKSVATGTASGATLTATPLASASPTSEAVTESSAVSATTATATASPTTAANETESAANSTAPASAAATSEFSQPLNSTNDPNKCHLSFEPDSYKNPFCKPVDGEEVLTGHEYESDSPSHRLSSIISAPPQTIANPYS